MWCLVFCASQEVMETPLLMKLGEKVLCCSGGTPQKQVCDCRRGGRDSRSVRRQAAQAGRVSRVGWG